MSWFQTSFSAATSGLASTLNNISGQLTDLTQDVLQEGVQSSFMEEEEGDIEELGDKIENKGEEVNDNDDVVVAAAAPSAKQALDKIIKGNKALIERKMTFSGDSLAFQPAVLSLNDDGNVDVDDGGGMLKELKGETFPTAFAESHRVS